MIKRSNFLNLLLIMALIGMISCEEEIILDTNGEFESQLVVNSLFRSDLPWSVNISTSSNILDNSNNIENVTNARVEIFDQNDEFLYDLDHTEGGNYSQGDFAPSLKRGYSVKVTVPGFKTVTAKSFVPEKSKLVINNFSIIPNDKRDDVEVDFQIEDRSELESYYIWEIVSLEEGGEGNPGGDPLSKTWLNELTNKSNTLIENEREILENGSFGDGTYSGTFSSIDDGRRISPNSGAPEALVSYVLKKNLPKQYDIDPDTDIPDDINHNNIFNENSSFDEDETEAAELKYELRVMTISKELFDYYSSVEAYLRFTNSSESPPFKIYTNVNNGLGIFAGYSESVIQF